MGVNFSLEIDEWNPFNTWGMREIFCSNDRFPLDIVACDGPEYIPHYRPTDIPQWRKNLDTLFVDAPQCLTMWRTAMDEFEEDPALYFTITY